MSDLKFHKTYTCEEDQHTKLCWKSWKSQAQVALDPLNVLAILSIATVRRSTVDQDDLKPNNRPIIYKFLKEFTSF